jgi:hypothetical protein
MGCSQKPATRHWVTESYLGHSKQPLVTVLSHRFIHYSQQAATDHCPESQNHTSVTASSHSSLLWVTESCIIHSRQPLVTVLRHTKPTHSWTLSVKSDLTFSSIYSSFCWIVWFFYQTLYEFLLHSMSTTRPHSNMFWFYSRHNSLSGDFNEI